jgi:hypothetical protein
VIDKSKFNFVIDAFMFLCMTAIAGLGFLMKFILIPGKERWLKYGRNVELTLFGMDRHQWGTIHLTIAFVLLTVLVLHIILHWKAILGLYQKLVASQTARRIVAVVFVTAAAFLLLVPLAVKPDVKEIVRGEGRAVNALGGGAGELPGGCDACIIAPAREKLAQEKHAHETHTAADPSITVRGYMTLGEVAEKYDVPVDCLKTHLGLPESTPGEEQLGRLRKSYDFTMSDVERIIAKFAKAQ